MHQIIKQVDQATVRRLLSAGLITAEDVTTMDTPAGQREYLPIALTLKGHRLLDKASEQYQRKKSTKKKKLTKRVRLLLSGLKSKITLTALVAIAGLYFTYKYTGAEDLRNKIYNPLNAELSKDEDSLKANNMSAPFQSNALSSLKQSGDFYRMPKPLQREVAAFYNDAGQIPGSVSAVTELLQRQFSSRIQVLRTEQSDAKWRAGAVARIQEQERQRPGISTMQSFTFNRTFIGRGVDVRDPNHPVIVAPGGPIWQINDWLEYPDSIEKVKSIWTGEDYLYLDDRDLWYYRITQEDLEQHRLSLKDFLQPVYDILTRDENFNRIRTQQPKLLEHVENLRATVRNRIDSPKQLADLAPWN
jgi:hypothetical protein